MTFSEIALQSNTKTVNTTIVSADFASYPVLYVTGTAGDVACTSIDAGIANQELKLIGTSDTNTVTISSSTANVKLQWGVSFTLWLWDTIKLFYSTVIGKRIEDFRSNNV